MPERMHFFLRRLSKTQNNFKHITPKYVQVLLLYIYEHIVHKCTASCWHTIDFDKIWLLWWTTSRWEQSWTTRSLNRRSTRRSARKTSPLLFEASIWLWLQSFSNSYFASAQVAIYSSLPEGLLVWAGGNPFSYLASGELSTKQHFFKALNPLVQCPPTHGLHILQKYKWHRLLAYDPNNDCAGIFMDWFLYPSCCVCRHTSFPLFLSYSYSWLFFFSGVPRTLFWRRADLNQAH